MNEPTIRVPVTCPECGKESLLVFPITELADALLLEKRLELRSICHGVRWIASSLEMDQLREYLSEVVPVDHIAARPSARAEK
jgi:hypothetical protein